MNVSKLRKYPNKDRNTYYVSNVTRTPFKKKNSKKNRKVAMSEQAEPNHNSFLSYTINVIPRNKKKRRHFVSEP